MNTHLRWLLAALGALGVAMAVFATRPSEAATGCIFSNGGAPAFCDTFDAPAGTGTRSGDLDGTIWGTSRIGDDNFLQGINNAVGTVASPCGGGAEAWPVRVCGGQLIDSVNDHEGVSNLAMYPKQPFDFAGRTGTIVFDVSNDTQGDHAAWPELWITTKPTPAPMDFFSGTYSTPEFGLALEFASRCGDVQYADAVANYQPMALSITHEACVTLSDGTSMNHYEVRVSQSRIEVWGTDAGGSALRRLNVITANLQFTRGLVWIDDVHYNACKTPNTQCVHSFRWDNVGFDGPFTYQDLTYDVLDNTELRNDGRINLGWFSANDGRVPTLTTVPIPDQATIDRATGTFVLVNAWALTKPATFTVQLNGGPLRTFANPCGPCTAQDRQTLYFPVPASDVRPGPNTVRIYADQQLTVFNVNILLVAAGLGGAPSPSPTNTPTTGEAPTSTFTAAPTPTATATATPTSTTAAPSPTSTPTTASTSTATPTPTRTSTPAPTPTPQACRLQVQQANGSFSNVNGTLQPYGSGRICVVP